MERRPTNLRHQQVAHIAAWNNAAVKKRQMLKKCHACVDLPSDPDGFFSPQSRFACSVRKFFEVCDHYKDFC